MTLAIRILPRKSSHRRRKPISHERGGDYRPIEQHENSDKRGDSLESKSGEEDYGGGGPADGIVTVEYDPLHPAEIKRCTESFLSRIIDQCREFDVLHYGSRNDYSNEQKIVAGVFPHG